MRGARTLLMLLAGASLALAGCIDPQDEPADESPPAGTDDPSWPGDQEGAEENQPFPTEPYTTEDEGGIDEGEAGAEAGT